MATILQRFHNALCRSSNFYRGKATLCSRRASACCRMAVVTRANLPRIAPAQRGPNDPMNIQRFMEIWFASLRGAPNGARRAEAGL